MVNMNNYVFFFELENFGNDFDSKLIEFDDTTLDESDQEKMPYSRLKDLREIPDKNLKNELQDKLRLFYDDILIEHIYITVCQYLEFPFQWLLIIFTSNQIFIDLEEVNMQFKHVIDSIQALIRRERFISTQFVGTPTIEFFFNSYRKTFKRLKINRGHLAIK